MINKYRINWRYMDIVIDKARQDLEAKIHEYSMSDIKIEISLGAEELEVLQDGLGCLEERWKETREE